MKRISLLLAALILVGSGSAHAASIVWGTPATCSADTDVLSTGTLRYAYTWSNTARTVNTVAFAGAGLTTATTGTADGNITLGGATLNLTAFTSTTPPFGTLSYRAMLTGAAYTQTSSPLTVTLNNLTVGVTYRLQLWCGDPRGSTTATRTTTATSLSGGSTVVVDYNVGDLTGGLCQHVIGTFTADATTQAFTLANGASNQVNALQLRSLPAGRWSGGVNGNWDDTTLNFTGASFTTAKAGGTVEFFDTDGNAAAVTRNSITIQNGGVTGANVVLNSASLAYTFNSSDANGIRGAFTITKSGAAAVTLAGANTHTGDTNLAAGTMNLGNTNALQNSALNFTGGTLAFTNSLTAYTFGNLKGNQTLTLNNNAAAGVTLTVGSDNQSATYFGAIGGAGTLVKTGTGTLTRSGATTATGGTRVNAGTLLVTAAHTAPMQVAGGTLSYLNGAVGTSAIGPLTVSSGRLALDLNATTADRVDVTGNVNLTGGTIELNTLAAPTLNTPYTLMSYTGTLVGTPAIVSNSRFGFTLNMGTGTNSVVTITITSLSTNLVWTGAVDNEWSLANKNNWTNSGTPDRFYTLDNVRFENTATSFAVNVPTTIVNPGNIVVDNTTNAYSISGAGITGTGSLTKHGNGSLTINSANTFSGGSTFNGGSSTLTNAGALGTGAVTVNAGASLNLTAPQASSVSFTGIGTTLTGSGTLNITPGTGSSTVTLNGNNAGFTGIINVGVGTPAGGGKALIHGLLPAAATVNALANGTIYVGLAITQPATAYLYGGDLGETLGQLRVEANGVWSGPIILAGDVSPNTDATIGANSGLGTYSGNISEVGGPRALLKGGVGTSVLTGNNSFTGATIINAGRLHLGTSTALGTGTGVMVTIKAATALQLNDGITISGKIASIAGSGFSTTDFNGALQTAAAGTATWAGPVVINDTAANTPRLGAGSGGRLIITGGISGGTGNNLFISAGSAAAAGVLSTVVLSAPSGESSYSGTTAIIRGVLQLGATDTLPKSTILDIDSTSAVTDVATVDLNGFNQEVAGLQDTATTNLNSILTNTSVIPATLTVNASSNYVFDGVITGNVGITKRGGGTLALNGSNSHTGNTSVLRGTLTVATPTLSDTAGVFISTGGVLNLTHTGTDTVRFLEINTVGQLAGIWGGPASDAPNKTSLISGAGKLNVLTGTIATPFSVWIDNYLTLTTPAQKTPTADPDGDGSNNFAEFAFGTDPTTPGSMGNHFVTWQDTNNDNQPQCILLLAVREGSSFLNVPQPTASKDGVNYLVQGSSTLNDFGQPGAPSLTPLGTWVPTVGTPEIPGGYEWQRFRMIGSEAGLTRGFFKATATSAP